jgi:hypothetical protein
VDNDSVNARDGARHDGEHDRDQAERPVILVVEDEALTIMDLSDVLDAAGFEALQSASAERAQMRPDLPIVVVSGRSKPDPERMPPHARFIARPCRGDDILELLRGLMTR